MSLPYFFLSYARLPPVSDEPVHDADIDVKTFFSDLSAAVAQHAGLPEDVPVGFADHEIPPASDWNAETNWALRTAQVFVPLYSPGYFKKRLLDQEQRFFRRRLAVSQALDPPSHIVPVLWTPFNKSQFAVESQDALLLGTDAPEYVAEGMRALCAIKHATYDQIVQKVAARIVSCAASDPLKPTAKADLGGVLVDAKEEAQFIIAILAPADKGQPAGDSWRPFGTHAMPIADYAVSTAQHLGLSTRVGAIDEVFTLVAKRPAIVLVDPWLLQLPDGRETLAAIQELPSWACPVVVTGQERYAEGQRLAAEVLKISSALSGAIVIGGLTEFIKRLPRLISSARNDYLRKSPELHAPGEPAERFSLRNPDAKPPMDGK